MSLVLPSASRSCGNFFMLQNKILLVACLLLLNSSLWAALSGTEPEDSEQVSRVQSISVEAQEAPENSDKSESTQQNNSSIPQPLNSTGQPKQAPVTGSALVAADPYTLLFGLLFIVLLIFGLGWLMRRFGAGALMGGQSMKVVSALSVGPREKVVLVEVGDQQLLLGVAPGRVSHLRDFEEPVVASSTAPISDFSQKLKQLLQQDKPADDVSLRTGVEK